MVCGVSMGLTNYFHPLLVALVGADCGLDEAVDTLPMVCDPYIGQLIYAVLYGITRYFLKCLIKLTYLSLYHSPHK